jgi:hypothetical protein
MTRYVPHIDTVYESISEEDPDGGADAGPVSRYEHPQALFVSTVLHEASQANKLGIRENDIIIECNTWKYNPDGPDNSDLLSKELFNSDAPVTELVLLRLSDKRNPIRHLQLPARNPDIDYVLKYLTHKEYKEIRQLLPPVSSPSPGR